VSRSALLAGATGLVGGHVLEQLLADETWSRVVTVGRRPIAQRHDKLEQRILDLGALDAVGDLPHADDVFCCLGTTIKQAGSQEAFRRVDHDFVLSLANAGLRTGATQFLLVSAIGADPEARVFYSRVKGEVESAVRALPYRAVQIFRPGLLLGHRSQPRPSPQRRLRPAGDAPGPPPPRRTGAPRVHCKQLSRGWIPSPSARAQGASKNERTLRAARRRGRRGACVP